MLTPALRSRTGLLMKGIALQGVETEKKYSHDNRFAVGPVINGGKVEQMARSVHGSE
jgi:hypothetical protein